MADLKYSDLIFTEPNTKLERNEGEIFFDGLFATPEMTGDKVQFLYSIVRHAHTNEEAPHIHDFPIYMSFMAADPNDIYAFDAEIECYLGGEKHVITKTSMVKVPAGLSHCPLIFKRVGKPIAFMEVHLTDNYQRRYA